MRGHEKIIEMRKQRSAPEFVFVNDYDCKTDWFDFGEYATVCTAGDSIASLDLRYLKGMRVSVSALTERRAKALFNACKDAGAATVAAAHIDIGVHPFDQRCWSEVWHAESEAAHG